jgi:3-methyl-2-oxobutanoate hydroxymethyltransferase
MTPQSVNKFGGFRVQGKGAAGKSIIEAAKQLESAGAFAVVLELIPGDLASDLTAEIGIPTIGIGAGPCCDGQIQVMHDILGFAHEEFKHARRFVEGERILMQGLREYTASVRNSSFPTEENTF